MELRIPPLKDFKIDKLLAFPHLLPQSVTWAALHVVESSEASM